jgi:hypothetical protein
MARMHTILIMILVLLSLVPPVIAQESGEKDSAPGFTNEDLEKYGSPQGGSDRDEEALKEQGREEDKAVAGKAKAEEKRDKQYWCTRGSYYRKKVDRARDGLTKAEKVFSKKEQDYHTGKIGSAAYDKAQKNLEKARLDLRQAEKNLNDVENEAHRQWIPPGWLRCQFE